ncbi:signal recognition particle protein [Roseospira marina]|uniref:Signal recognition particle protein n=1 Tax=Roseospira marina TaxID=140057 RepID=A0A5M6I980_9PROT|nr:signal recognition particle protein [Roseospira marina]KAA5604781.1 signal recognition particle protein [Roseospira marina]MBB4313465.1 signal recognition particle subunit SRP54 [Roseospira marina]MBB5086627.1 signal recognition particle subunit SRP54 [Roseospira marina]
MFEGLSGRLGDVLEKLRGKGSITQDDVNAAMREVRIALLEADVALPVVKDFVNTVKERAVGQEVIKSVTPGQMVIKIVHDALVEMLSGRIGSQVEDEEDDAEARKRDRVAESLNLNATPPVPILMVGLQGSGKTTTSAKIGLRLKSAMRKKVLMASLDVQRPAAQHQLAVLGEQTGVDTLPIIMGQQPVQIARRALDEGRKGGYDVVILDTAGRLAIDEELMEEVAEVRKVTNPAETLLVTDAMIGQDAVTVATEFNDKVGISGIVLTRVDGDARGGAALSMRAITGRPIKLMGVGEKMDALEEFQADRIAGRILGMGDVVSLVEKAAQSIQMDEAEKIARRMEKGKFDLEDLLSQLRQVRRMGDIKGLLGLMPGVAKMKKQIDAANIDDSMIKRQEAVILSMTLRERRHPEIIKASRKKRIAAGAGTTVPEVNKLLKQHQQMAMMMKKMKKMGGMKGMAERMGGLFGGGAGGMGDMAGLGDMDPKELAAMAKKGELPPELAEQIADGKMPPGLGGDLGGGAGGAGLPPGLGSAAGLPGRSGLPTNLLTQRPKGRKR